MPIIKHNGKVLYFAHIPKCGGTSVDRFARELVGGLSFHDPKFASRENPWTTTSPQHVEWDQMEALFSQNFFDQKFTLVRDPVDRFFSAFNHNRRIGRISRFTSIKSILKKLENGGSYFSNQFDNHFLPASRIAPADCKVFYLEDGLETLETWLKDVLEIDSAEIKIKHHNKGENVGRKIRQSKKLSVPALGPETIAKLKSEAGDRIREIYREDYDRFDF